MRRLSLVSLALLATGAVVTPAAAAPALAAEAPAASQEAVVAAARALVRDHYVLPDVAEKLDAALAAALAAGRYEGLSGGALAEALNATLKSVTKDGHLSVVHDPGRAAMLAQMSGAKQGDDEISPQQVSMVALNNGGVRKLEHLPGNIRYMDYSGFMWGAPAAEAAIENAMDFLRGGSAIIIDLRNNGGGSPDAVAKLASYFVPAGTPLMEFRMRGETPTASVSSAAPFTLADRPVFVLTSKNSVSAAEEFAAHVDAFGFGKLVGETTAGAGFRNEFYALPDGLVISVSTGQALQAKTGKGWEGTGIEPAFATTADNALALAQARAIAAMAKTAPDGQRQALEKMLPLYEAMAAKVAAAMPLGDYAGSYGPISISLSDGRLMSVTPGGSSPLTAIGRNAFVPDEAPGMRVEFVVENGKVAALEFPTPQGPQRFARQ